jgi:hypothetical protein
MKIILIYLLLVISGLYRVVIWNGRNLLHQAFCSIFVCLNLSSFCILLLEFLLLSLEVVLGKIAVLTESIGVMRLKVVLTLRRHLWFALTVVAMMAHIPCILLLVNMRTLMPFTILNFVQSCLNLVNIALRHFIILSRKENCLSIERSIINGFIIF